MVGGMESSCRLTMASIRAGPSMTERLLDHRSDLIRRFGSEPKDAGSVGQYSSNLVGDCQSLGAGPAPGPLGSSFRGKTGAAVNAADAAAARV